MPYATLTRRAQLYIDHPWFIEAGEALPTHKANPPMGGDFPLVLTRRALPLEHPHDEPDRAGDAGNTSRRAGRAHRRGGRAARGIVDGQTVRVRNDVASFVVQAKVTGGVQPGQVISYNLGVVPVRRLAALGGGRAGDGEVVALRGRRAAPEVLDDAMAAGADRPGVPRRD